MSTSAKPTPDVSALMQSIQVGARLKKAVTNDRSAAPVSGRVLGDPSPPSQAEVTASPTYHQSPAPEPRSLLEPIPEGRRGHAASQSIDWLGGLASEQGVVADHPASTPQEDSGQSYGQTDSVPAIHVDDSAVGGDQLKDIDMNTGKSSVLQSGLVKKVNLLKRV